MINNPTKLTLPSNRVQFFPIMMFAIVMGMSGITITFQKLKSVLQLDIGIDNILVFLDSSIFLIILGFYGLKIITNFKGVKEEFTHPIRINFFAASSISFLLISIVYQQISPLLSQYTFYIGTTFQTFFTFYTISFWINKEIEMQHSNPSWFIPVVGNILVPVAGVQFASTEFLMYYFSVGLFFWIILTSIIINRVIFHHQLANKFMPTLFIFIAPPAIGCVAYVNMFNEFDFFALILYNLGLFFSFLLFFMYKNFLKLKFFISWWAFTFPLASISIASILAYHKTGLVFYSYFAYMFTLITAIVVSIVAFKTISHMLKREICIEE